MFNKYFVSMFFSRLISGSGDAIYFVVSYWLIWDLTKSTTLLGIAGAASALGALAGFFSGYIIDKTNRILIMIISDIVRAGIVIIIPITLYFDVTKWWMIVLVLFLIAIMNEFFNPAQQTILSKIVPENKISNGVGALFMAEQLSFMIGRILGGLIIVYVGIAWGFVINSGTFLLSFIFVTFILIFSIIDGRRKDFKNPNSEGSVNEGYISSIKEVFHYIKRQPFLLNSIIIFFFLTFSYSPMLILMSSWADEVLNKGALGYSILQTVFPLGMILGAIISPVIQKKLTPKYLISIFLLVVSLNIICFSFSKSIILSSINLIVIGMGVALTSTLIMSIQQKIVDDHIKGRYFSISQSLITLLQPLGYVVAGIVSDWIGMVNTMFISGGCFLATFFFVLISSAFDYEEKSTIQAEKLPN